MSSKILIPAMIALMGVGASAWADDHDDEGEVTISLMPASADESPEAVTKQISLPDLVNLVGNEKAQDAVKKRAVEALEEAGTKGNREQGNREHGWSQANEARQQARSMAEDAKARNENRSRGQENRPERPDTPEPPGPPDSPPGQN